MRALRRVGGVTELLKLAYPAHEWQEWKFKKASSHYWDSLENQKKFVEWLQPRLNITRLDQWYSITAEPVHKNGGSCCFVWTSLACLHIATLMLTTRLDMIRHIFVE
jgi:hypothetical protein